jgi:guanylate kinase
MKGKLIIFSAPSGAGKTTIVKHLLQQNLDLEFSVSATSRKPRPGESDGKDYYFLTKEQFKNKINNGEFLEWEEVYQDIFYGTLKSEVERIRNSQKNVIFDVDVVGGMNIKNYYKQDALAVFVMPPSAGDLKIRLENRATDNEQSIRMRVEKALAELKYADHFDVVVINNDLSVALDETKKIVSDFIAKGSPFEKC